MSSVDNRVVSMKFDNSVFETNAAQSLTTLEKLRQALNFGGATKGMSDIQEASRRFDFNPVASAVEGVSAKFVALSTIAITALSNITSRVVDTGVQMAKSFSLDQVISGFQEYQTNINSIQTILANTKSKGATLDDVNKSLDELNHYADQTIYNFSEMTRSIGTFTAAGVDLDLSVQSIKGIANLAAISGSNSQQASTAMYQLSQAIAAGSVKLMDWNSVVNAGMGGEVFQKALFETGKAMKTIKGVDMSTSFEDWTKAGNTFRGSLEQGWLTADVLTKTLSGFTGDLTEAQIVAMGYTKAQAKNIMEMGQTGKDAATQVKTLTQLMDTLKEAVGSGWATSFRTVFGDFEEAKNLFSGLSGYFGNIASESANARNELLNGWKALGGREVLFQALVNGFAALETAIKPIKDAFRDIFPPMTAERLFNMTVSLRDFLANLKMGDGTVSKLTSIFRGFFAGIEIGWTVIKTFAGAIAGLFGTLTDATGSGALSFLAGLGDQVTNLNKVLVDGGGIAEFFDKARVAIGNFIDGLNLGPAVDKIVDVLGKIKDGIVGLFGDAADLANSGGGVLSALMDRLRERFGFVGDAIQKLRDMWSSFFNSSGGGPVGELTGFVDSVKEVLTNMWDTIAESLSDTDFSGVFDALNVGLLGGIVLLFRKFLNDGISLNLFGDFFDKLGGLAKKFGGVLDGLTSHLKAMQAGVRAKTLLTIAGALGILTLSALTLASIDSAALTKAMIAIGAGFAMIVVAMNQLGDGASASVKLPLVTFALIGMTSAIFKLALAAKLLSTLDWNELAKGLTGVGALMLMLVATAKPLSAMSDSVTSVLALAVSIDLLVFAVKQFAQMSWEELGKGLLGVAVTLASLVIAMRNMPTEDIFKTSLGMIALAVGLTAVGLAVRIFSSMNSDELLRGLLGVTGALVAITVAMRNMPEGMLDNALGIAAVGIALSIMGKAISSLGSMSWEDLAKGLGSVVVILAAVAIAMDAMEFALPGAAALVVVSGAMWIMAEVLEKIGTLSWGDLLKGLVGLAAILVILGGAAIILGPVIPAILALGVALGVVGIAFALFGAGAYLVAEAFIVMAEAGSAGVKVFGEVLDTLIEKIPAAVEALIVGLIGAVTRMVESAPQLVEAVVTLVSSMLDGLATLIPKLGETIGLLIEEFLRLLQEYAPSIIQAGWDLLVQLLTGIRDHIGEVTTMVSEIIVNFLNAFAPQIPLLIAAGANVLAQVLQGISNNLGTIATAATDVVTEFIEQLGNSALDIIEAGGNFVIKLIEGIGQKSQDIVTAGADAVVDFLDGLSQNIDKVIQAGWDFIINFVNGLADSVEDNYPKLEKAGKRLANAIMDAFKNTLSDAAGAVKDAALAPFKGAYEAVLDFFDVHSPSRLMIGLTGYIVDGFVVGMDQNTVRANKSAVNFGENVAGTLQTSFNKIATSVDGMSEFRPTITPVLDLSNVTRDAKAINTLFDVKELVPSVSYSQASALSAAETAQADQAATTDSYDGPREIKFEQNNYSPEALSTGDIYRNTKSQIALAKDELGVP